ncbi:unnamed protein product [Alternaria alternata]
MFVAPRHQENPKSLPAFMTGLINSRSLSPISSAATQLILLIPSQSCANTLIKSPRQPFLEMKYWMMYQDQNCCLDVIRMRPKKNYSPLSLRDQKQIAS